MTSQFERTSSSCLRVLSSEGDSRSFQSLRGIRESRGTEVQHRVTSAINYREVRPSPSSPLFLRLASWHDRAFRSFPSCWTRSVISERSGTQMDVRTALYCGSCLASPWRSGGLHRAQLGTSHAAHTHTSSQGTGNRGLTCFQGLFLFLHCALQRRHLLSQVSAWKTMVQHQGPICPHPLLTLRDQGLSPASSSCL